VTSDSPALGPLELDTDAPPDESELRFDLADGLTTLAVSGVIEDPVQVLFISLAAHLTGISGRVVGDGEEEEPSVEELIVDLVQSVANLNLQAGISNALDAKLDAAMNALADVNQHNDAAAVNSLNALINSVQAQRGRRLTDAEADMLIAATLAIIAAIQAAGPGS
jgi:hypothetical protein